MSKNIAPNALPKKTFFHADGSSHETSRVLTIIRKLGNIT